MAVELKYVLMFIRIYLMLYVMKRRSVHVPLELRWYSDLSWHIKEPQNSIYCFNFLKKNKKKLKAENLFHTRSNLLSLVCLHFVSFLFAQRCIFYFVRTWCVVWEWHGLSDIAAVTKDGGFLRSVIIPQIWSFRSWNCDHHNMTISYLKLIYLFQFIVILTLWHFIFYSKA